MVPFSLALDQLDELFAHVYYSCERDVFQDGCWHRYHDIEQALRYISEKYGGIPQGQHNLAPPSHNFTQSQDSRVSTQCKSRDTLMIQRLGIACACGIN